MLIDCFIHLFKCIHLHQVLDYSLSVDTGVRPVFSFSSLLSTSSKFVNVIYKCIFRGYRYHVSDAQGLKEMWNIFFFLQLGESVIYDKIPKMYLKTIPPRAVHD